MYTLSSVIKFIIHPGAYKSRKLNFGQIYKSTKVYLFIKKFFKNTIRSYIEKVSRREVDNDEQKFNVVMKRPMYRTIECFAASNNRSFNNEILIRLAKTLYEDEQNEKS